MYSMYTVVETREQQSKYLKQKIGWCILLSSVDNTNRQFVVFILVGCYLLKQTGGLLPIKTDWWVVTY